MDHTEHINPTLANVAIADSRLSNFEQSANGGMFKANPKAIEEVYSEQLINYSCEAANGKTYASAMPRALADINSFTKQCAEVLDAPVDAPGARYASLGLACALNMVATDDESVRALAERVLDTEPAMQGLQAPGMALESLARRKGAYLLYELAIQIGQRSAEKKELDPIVLNIIGHWYVRRFVDNWAPNLKAIARARNALIRPTGIVSQGWPIVLRTKALNKAKRDLQVAITNNPGAARTLGLTVREIKTARAHDPISVLNRAIRRRVNNLIDFSSQSAVSAAGGYGTRSRNTLRVAGQKLRDRVMSGDASGMHIALEVISHLPSATLQLVPVVYEGSEFSIADALAWLDLTAGTFNNRLFWLDESGARPTEESSDCYESTVQLVSIPLSPFLRLGLLERLRIIGGEASTVSDLLGPVVHHPRSSIDGGGGYRCTVRRLQESLPAILVQDGMNRWPVALGTSSLFLVSRGRRAYGVCRKAEVDRIVNEAYKLLDWPAVARADEDDQLIGSFVSPKADAVTRALNLLAERADSFSERPLDCPESITRNLNAHAVWMAAFISLAFALRRSTTYQLNQGELRCGSAVHINDKSVHEYAGPPVPVSAMVKGVVTAWFNFCQRIVDDLRRLGDTASLDLAQNIEKHNADPSRTDPVFLIDAGGRLQGVGSDSWHAVLPTSLRLVKNFARHFWPLRLMDCGIEQLLTDVLMRHQLAGVRASSSSNSKRRSRTEQRLAAAMDCVLRELCLKLPAGLKNGR